MSRPEPLGRGAGVGAAGRPEPPRAVSLLPAATEIAGALGLLDRVLAVSHECDAPPAAREKPRITRAVVDGTDVPGREVDALVGERLEAGLDLYSLDEELLRRLRPDVILSQELCAVCAPAYDSVSALAQTLPGPPRVLNLEPESLEDVFGDVRRVAEALGEPERGDALVRELRSRVEAVREGASGAGCGPRVAVLEWLDPVFASGHWTPELVALAGGEEVLGRAGAPSARSDWDAVAEARPEVLVVACCGWPVERALHEWQAVREDPGIRKRIEGLPAAVHGRIHVCDGSAYFSRPGPRLVDSLEILATLLHPDRFAGRLPDPAERGVVRAPSGAPDGVCR